MAAGTVIPNAALAEAAKLFCGDTADAFTAVAVGTSDTTPAAADTTLGAEITTNGLARSTADTSDYEADYKAHYVHTWTASGGSHSVNAFGIPNNASAGGDLGLHTVFSSTQNVSDGGSLQVTANVTMSDATA